MPDRPGHEPTNNEEVYKVFFGKYPETLELYTFLTAWPSAAANLAPLFHEKGHVISFDVPDAEALREVFEDESNWGYVIKQSLVAEMERSEGIARSQMFYEAARQRGILPVPEDDDGWAFMQDMLRQLERAALTKGINVPFETVLSEGLPEDITEFRQLQASQAMFEEGFATGFNRIVAQQGIEFLDPNEKRRVMMELSEDFSNAQFTSEKDIAVGAFLDQNLVGKIDVVRTEISKERGEDIFDATLSKLRQIDPARAARLVGGPPGGPGAVSRSIEERNIRAAKAGEDIVEDLTQLTEEQRHQLFFDRYDALKEVSELKREQKAFLENSRDAYMRLDEFGEPVPSNILKLEAQLNQDIKAAEAKIDSTFNREQLAREQHETDVAVSALPGFGPGKTRAQRIEESKLAVFEGKPRFTADEGMLSAFLETPEFKRGMFSRNTTVDGDWWGHYNVTDNDFARHLREQLPELKKKFVKGGDTWLKSFEDFLKQEMPGMRSRFKQGDIDVTPEDRKRTSMGKRRARIRTFQKPIGNLPTR